MSATLVPARPQYAMELRGAWATGRRMAVRIDADVERAEGQVTAVSATGAYAVVAGLHVPLCRVLSLHRPSRLGDSKWSAGQPWAWAGRAPKQNPGQLSFPTNPEGAS